MTLTKKQLEMLGSEIKELLRNPPSTRQQTIWLAKAALDAIENWPEEVEPVLMTIDFRTGKIDVDQLLKLREPLERVVVDLDRPEGSSTPCGHGHRWDGTMVEYEGAQYEVCGPCWFDVLIEVIKDSGWRGDPAEEVPEHLRGMALRRLGIIGYEPPCQERSW